MAAPRLLCMPHRNMAPTSICALKTRSTGWTTRAWGCETTAAGGLTYADIMNLSPTADPRDPDREIQLHLTGNMTRYMWSINGEKFANAEPLELAYGERVRITLVNDTMMNHPMHLHGMWSDLETGDGERIPRKHTVIVQPGSRISYLVTADAPGRLGLITVT